MILGLRPISFTIRLVDASHFDVERCLACGAKLTPRIDADGRAFVWETDHRSYCMTRSWTRYSIPTPDCTKILDVLDLEPRG